MTKVYIELEKIQDAIDAASPTRLAEYLESVTRWDVRQFEGDGYYVHAESSRLLEKLKDDPAGWDGRVKLFLNRLSYNGIAHKLMMNWRLNDNN